MNQLKKGTYVRWENTDSEGAFHHYGRIISHKNGMIVMQDAKGGEMGFPDDDGTVVVLARKPAGFNPPLTEPVYGKKRTKAPAKKPPFKNRKPGAPSKKDLALKIYIDLNSSIDQKVLTIETFRSELNMSLAGATTYYYTCKKLAAKS